MKTDLILNFKQNLFSKVIWSSTFKCDCIFYTEIMWYLKAVKLIVINKIQIFKVPNYIW